MNPNEAGGHKEHTLIYFSHTKVPLSTKKATPFYAEVAVNMQLVIFSCHSKMSQHVTVTCHSKT